MILGGQLPGKVGSRWGKYSSLAQSVEHSAVNRVVVGSSPTGGAKTKQAYAQDCKPTTLGIDEKVKILAFEKVD